MDDLEKVNSLNLYEEIEINDFSVLRVPGGFIYSRRNYIDSDKPEFSCFVPLSNEFKKESKPRGLRRTN